MRAADLARLYDYSCWATRKLLAVVERLGPEEFTRDVAGSYGSVRNTLVHTLSAEWGWLERCGGFARGPKLEYDAFPTARSLVETWATVEGHMRAFLAELPDDALARDVRFALGTGAEHVVPLGDLLQHAIAHGVHHRGQVSLLLRMLGHAPGNYDMLIWFFEEEAARVR